MTEETTVYEEIAITMQLDAMHDHLEELAKRIKKLEDRIGPIYDNGLKRFV